MDVKSAFRIIPVHPDDRLLLGTQWEKQYYVDTVLPFGLRSAPKIFNAVADALQWVVKQNGVTYLEHYLDDFTTVGGANTEECADNLSTLLQTCSALGVPVAPEKTVSPTLVITFLGILAGILEDAARIIIPGKAFLRRIYNAIALLSIQTTSSHPPERGSSFRYSLVALIHGKMKRYYFVFHLLQDSPVRGSHSKLRWIHSGPIRLFFSRDAEMTSDISKEMMRLLGWLFI